MMAHYAAALVRFLAHVLSFSQILLYLPLALDIGGRESMLALSLLLTVSFGASATLHLAVRNTRWKPVSTAWSVVVQPLVVIPASLLLTLNLYSNDHHPKQHPLALDMISSWSPLLVSVASTAPRQWANVLATLSPVFVLLEGLCTLLCIQSVSRFASSKIESSRTYSGDLMRLGTLVLSSVVYVANFWFLFEAYGSVTDTVSATLIGVAVTAILFLSGISFSIHKGSVVETSLMLAYAVFQIFHLSARPQMYSGGILKHVLNASGTNGHPPLPPVVLQSLDALSSAVSQTFGAGVEFVQAASSAIPIHVLVGLLYRVCVLYAATRIVLTLKRDKEAATRGARRSSSYSEEDDFYGGAGRRSPRRPGPRGEKNLFEEEPAARVMTIVLTYSRAGLIAVYTHLLLEQHQSYWAWVNIFATITLWAIELRIGNEDERNESDATTAASAATSTTTKTGAVIGGVDGGASIGRGRGGAEGDLVGAEGRWKSE